MDVSIEITGDYKTRDFPSAMSQEYTLVLALAYSVNFDKNIFYYKNKNVHKWVSSRHELLNEPLPGIRWFIGRLLSI